MKVSRYFDPWLLSPCFCADGLSDPLIWHKEGVVRIFLNLAQGLPITLGFNINLVESIGSFIEICTEISNGILTFGIMEIRE